MRELTDLMKLNLHATEMALRSLNDTAEGYGLSLNDAQIAALAAARGEALARTGRVELGEGILPKLANAFMDSPYIQRGDYAETLGALQELFYQLKNECEDGLTDDELVEAMQTIYNHKAHGSLEYLENLSVEHLYRALRSSAPDEEEDDEDDWVD